MSSLLKYLISLVALFLFVGLSSCKDDFIKPIDLRGTWESVQVGGVDDPYYRKSESFTFDKFDIGMYYFEETRGEEKIDYRVKSFDYSLFENVLTINFADGTKQSCSISLEKDILIIVSDKTVVYTRKKE